MAAQSRPELPAAPIGEYCEAAGRRLWVHQLGSGRPTVVVLPGAGTVGLDYLNLAESLARTTRTVLYDRAASPDGPIR